MGGEVAQYVSFDEEYFESGTGVGDGSARYHGLSEATEDNVLVLLGGGAFLGGEL